MKEFSSLNFTHHIIKKSRTLRGLSDTLSQSIYNHVEKMMMYYNE